MANATSTQDGSPREDTAITKSWDRVVGDYKIFQDVRARGGTVDDLRAFLRENPTGPEMSQNAKPETTRRTAQEGERSASTGQGSAMAVTADDEGVTAAAVSGCGSGAETTKNEAAPAASRPAPASAPASTTAAGTNGQAFSTATSNTPPVPGLLSPQTVLGGADEGLKKLLMSWYYAGYYTGLYEGQQQVAQQQPQTQAPYEEAQEGADGIDLDLDDGQEMQQ